MTHYLFSLPISKGQLTFYSEGTIPSWPLQVMTSQMSYQITLMSLSSPPELVAGCSGMAYVPRGWKNKLFPPLQQTSSTTLSP